MKWSRNIVRLCLLGLIFLFSLILVSGSAGEVKAESNAIPTASEAELQKQIDQKNEEIKKLEGLAKTFRETIATTQEQAATLKEEIARVNRAIAKLQNDIKLIQERIKLTNLEIKQLSSKIGDAEKDIAGKRKKLAELLRNLAESDQNTPIEILLKNDSFSDFFTEIEASKRLQESIYTNLTALKFLNTRLAKDKSESEVKVTQLKSYAVSLSDKQKLQAIEQQEKKKVLTETQNQEKKYQNLLSENEKKRKALEDEILSFERQLKYTLDPSSLPEVGGGILKWPVPVNGDSFNQCGRSVTAFLTQCFGNTEFARSGAYAGKGHNGVDFRASSGTEILSAESGVVRAIGDTDSTCRRASYGKWILIDHDNNLSTLYAHNSLVKVSPGTRVSRGEVIAYSGQSGYATGPHLHFSVFAKDAVTVGKLRSRVCGTVMTLPLSPFSGYLNPLDYL